MSNSFALSQPNLLVAENTNLLHALRDRDSRVILLAIGRILSGPVPDQVATATLESALGVEPGVLEEQLAALVKAGLIDANEGELSLTTRGRRWTARILTDLGRLVGEEVGGRHESAEMALQGEYLVAEEIGRGATSVTFRAEHLVTHSNRAMKVYYPGYLSPDELADALEARHQVESPVIPAILDAGLISGGRHGFPTDVVCIVQELVADAMTFEEFLRTEFYSPPHVIERFIREVGSALSAIHSAGLQHGDLHANNILVSHDDFGEPRFHVVDFDGAGVQPSPYTEQVDDDQHFIRHLITCALIAHEREPTIPMRRLLGERVFRVEAAARDGDISTVGEALALLAAPLPQSENTFKPARRTPFEWLRVENVPTHADLLRLFEPSAGRFSEIQQFGNTWVSGPRGCGKSHYVRVLTFFADLERARLANDAIEAEYERLHLDFRDLFGILVPCRVGTFKSMTPEALGRSDFTLTEQRILKDVLVLAIVSETLALLVAGGPTRLGKAEPTPLGAPDEIDRLWTFWRDRVPRSGVPGSPIAQLEQIQEEAAAELLAARGTWFTNRTSVRAMFDDADLAEFFFAVNQTYERLESARFQIIFDDVTHGIVHYSLQKVLNSLVRSAGERHCFKLTCERYQYTLDTIDGRSIEFPHDATFVDLGELAVGAAKGAPTSASSYMRAVVNRRLALAGWSDDIEGIVGRSAPPREFLRELRLTPNGEPSEPATVASEPRNDPNLPAAPEAAQTAEAVDAATYAGWNVLCHLAHGSVRNLLEMLEAVFNAAGGTESAVEAGTIEPGLQDRALREYARRHWKELQNLPGRIGTYRTGPQLQAVAAALGELSRRLLLYYDSQSAPYEAISIERLDTDRPLSPEADRILEAALQYGVLMAAGANFSRSHRGLTTRFDLNKLFAPAFRTTYRVRNHIYVGGLEFEEFLLRPGSWSKRRAKTLVPRENQPELPW